MDNLLPFDGTAWYAGPVFSAAESQRYLQILLQTIHWRHDEVIMFGKKIVTSRKVAWYGDQSFAYTYARISRQALPWSPELLRLKAVAEAVSGDTYNSCLLNL